jgi:hypothetical protein
MRRPWIVGLALALGMCAVGPSAAEGPCGTPPGVNPACCPATGPGCCGDCCCVPPDGHFYGGIDYLLWWLKRDREPALVTSGSPADRTPGALGQPGTDVLFGGRVGSQPHHGIRATAGYAGDGGLGLEVGYFALEQRSAIFDARGAGTPGSPIIARPFFDPNFNAENARIIAAPGFRAGEVESALHQRLSGAEGNLTLDAWAEDFFRLRLLTGFRFLALDEGLDITERFAARSFGGSSEEAPESFGTHNRFYGWQLGAAAEIGEQLFVRVAGKVAFGGNDQVVNINGALVTSNPFTGTFAGPGGLLAQTSNIGRHHVHHFAVVPQLDVNAGYHFSECLKAYVGYSLLGISDVVRPGDQIDRVVQLPTIPPDPGVLARPLFTPRQSGFWAQGITVGVALSF